LGEWHRPTKATVARSAKLIFFSRFFLIPGSTFAALQHANDSYWLGILSYIPQAHPHDQELAFS
jgi:hypothetical protein